MDLSEDKQKGRVVIGSDHAGYALKEHLKKTLSSQFEQVTDLGTYSDKSCDYTDFAAAVALEVSRGKAIHGVLICATGAGMSIVANKFPGVRAVACNDHYTAEYSRRHNDANIITIGASMVTPEQANTILRKFLEAGFDGDREGGERHRRRVNKIIEIDRENLK
ncbi:MAG: ribose 5-phosphate isomerase B [Actinobacteria bacterium]|nr:ribose 5-phosphate isomerase B [Actinomycetota bacterium]